MLQAPDSFAPRLEGCSWERITLGMSGADVYKLRSSAGVMYLKVQKQSKPGMESLEEEKARLGWLQGRLAVPSVLAYESDGNREYLLMSEIQGTNASDSSFQDRLPELMGLLAAGLKSIHAVPAGGCPFVRLLDAKLREATYRVAHGLVDEAEFDACRQGRKAAELMGELMRERPADEDLVFTHGDYCLPNIIIQEGKVSGFIDWGRGGVADRYQDLALAARSIEYNFGRAWVAPFLAAYGITEADEAKLRYYRLLDEFF